MGKEWSYKKLGDLFPYIKNGANIKQVKEANGLPITRIETLSGGVFNRDRMGYADIYEIGKFKEYILEDGDLLMSHINSKTYIGRTVEYKADINETIIHGMNLLRLKGNTDILSSYFAYYTLCDGFKNDIARIRKDAVNQSSMAISDLRKIAIPVPSKSLQTDIVAELDKINNLIRIKKEQLLDYKKLSQSIFLEMFGDPHSNEKGWNMETLGDVCAPKSQISRASKTFKSTAEIKYIDISSIDNSAHEMTECTTYIMSEAPSRAQQCVNKGDIVISTVRPNLKNIAIVNKEDDNLVASSGFCVLRPMKINRNFLFHYILSEYYTDYLVSLTTGANYPAVRDADILKSKIIYPPISLQQDFSKRIELIERQRFEINKTISNLEKLLASRIQYWFLIQPVAEQIVENAMTEDNLKELYQEYRKGKSIIDGTIHYDNGSPYGCTDNNMDFRLLADIFNYMKDSGDTSIEAIEARYSYTSHAKECVLELKELGLLTSDDLKTFHIV